MHWSLCGVEQEIVTTPGHRFLTEAGAFRAIQDMVADGRATIVLQSGTTVSACVEHIIYSAETEHLFEAAAGHVMSDGALALAPSVPHGWQTYNFEVEDLHTYVANGVRVHNDSGVLGNVGEFVDEAVLDPVADALYCRKIAFGGLSAIGGALGSVFGGIIGADGKGDGCVWCSVLFMEDFPFYIYTLLSCIT